MFKFPDEVDHVLAHGAPVDLVEIAPALVPRILCLHLLHNLLAEAADLGRALDVDILSTFISATR